MLQDLKKKKREGRGKQKKKEGEERSRLEELRCFSFASTAYCGKVNNE